MIHHQMMINNSEWNSILLDVVVLFRRIRIYKYIIFFILFKVNEQLIFYFIIYNMNKKYVPFYLILIKC